MILEVAILDIKPNQEKKFEAAFDKAQKIISSMDGYISHQLQKCMEKNNRYILLEPVQDRYELLTVVGGRSAETGVYWSK